MSNKHSVFPPEDECNCVLPEQRCHVCIAIARKVYGKDWWLEDYDENSNQELIPNSDEYVTL